MEVREKKSCHIAKDRLKVLVLADRMGCSPDLFVMLKHDVLSCVSRYLSVDTEQASISISQRPPVITAYLPLKETAGNGRK